MFLVTKSKDNAPTESVSNDDLISAAPNSYLHFDILDGRRTRECRGDLFIGQWVPFMRATF